MMKNKQNLKKNTGNGTQTKASKNIGKPQTQAEKCKKLYIKDLLVYS